MYKTLIIAEAGVNHNGELGMAKQLITAAAEAGADIVKFQTFKSEKVISRFAVKAEYQKALTGSTETQLEMVKKLELDLGAHIELQKYCREKGVEFLSTPFDLESIVLLDRLGLKRFKIPSGEITNYPFLKSIAGYNKQVIMSTGMARLGEVESALKVLTNNGMDKEKITILHCNTEYPTPYEDVNLRAMQTLKQAFGVSVGYSDHTQGIEVPIAAVALGATVIEKHFTLDRTLPGPDHKASLEPLELNSMVSAIRNIEKSMGDGIKKPSSSEVKNIPVARKSIIAARDIKVGEIFTEENITTKRPGDGISPMRWNEILGRKATRDFNEDQLIEI